METNDMQKQRYKESVQTRGIYLFLLVVGFLLSMILRFLNIPSLNIPVYITAVGVILVGTYVDYYRTHIRNKILEAYALYDGYLSRYSTESKVYNVNDIYLKSDTSKELFDRHLAYHYVKGNIDLFTIDSQKGEVPIDVLTIIPFDTTFKKSGTNYVVELNLIFIRYNQDYTDSLYSELNEDGQIEEIFMNDTNLDEGLKRVTQYL